MVIIIGSLLLIVCTFIIVRAPRAWLRIWKKYMMRTIVAVLMLIVLNMIGNAFGLHIPINLFTVGMTSMFGISGLITIISLQFFLI